MKVHAASADYWGTPRHRRRVGAAVRAKARATGQRYSGGDYQSVDL